MFHGIIRHVAPLLAAAACALGTEPEPPANAVRVLFIGNSLTYFNNLPRTLRDLAAAAGERPCHCVAIAYPNFSLEDHYLVGDAVRELVGGDYDFVVMQQGPSALPESRASLIQGARAFATHIREEGATGVMYAVWPSTTRSFDFPAVNESYRAAADSIGARLAPAGDAWQRAWARDPSLPLFSNDGFHPSPMGTWLAALAVFEAVYQRPLSTLGSSPRVDGTVQSWPAATVRLLLEAAAEAGAVAKAR